MNFPMNYILKKIVNTCIVLLFLTIGLFAQESRTFDGTGNNQNQPDWGAAHSLLLTATSNGFSDSISMPGGQDRPNPRTISNTLFDQQDFIQDELELSDFVWVFGQFIDHDLDLVDNEFSEPLFIPVPAGDAYFDPNSTGNAIIPMFRSRYDTSTGTSPDNPRQFINEITSWLDASMVYGSSEERAEWLRTFEDGKLKVSEGDLLPFNTLSGELSGETDPNAPFMEDGGYQLEKLFVAGDVRANEQPLLLALHTLFVREHNRLCNDLKFEHPDWTDEELFQHARRINIGLIQAIVYEEWLPSMGIKLPPYLDYDDSVNPNIMNVFSAAAFRLGHTLVNTAIIRIDQHGETILDGDLTMKEGFFNPISIKNEGGLEPLLKGMATQPQQHLDCQIVSDLRNFLFGQPGQGGLDLAAININRGRERGLPDYNTIRQDFGLSPIESLSDISGDLTLINQLETVYNDVNNIDPWVGMLAESHPTNTIAGETIRTIVKQQFQSLRDGDRFYYENDSALSQDKITQIKNTRLSDIIRRNSEISILQDNVFFAVPHDEILATTLKMNQHELEIDIYPNPLPNEELHVAIYSNQLNEIELQVADMLGRLVDNKKVTLQQGMNHFSFFLDAALPKGVYQILISEKSRGGVVKFVKI